MVLKKVAAGENLATPEAPTFDGTDINVSGTVGVTYKRADDNSALVPGTPITLASGESLKIYATPNASFYFANNVDDEWTFKNTN